MRLSHDRWYSRHGQLERQQRAFRQSSALRKVTGLGLLLALVIVLMQQLTDPAKYGPAFQAIGLTLPAQSPESINSAQPKTFDAGTEEQWTTLRDHAFQTRSAESDRAMQAWLALFEKASADTISYLAASELRPSGASPKIEMPTDFQTWLQQTSDRLLQWQSVVRNPESPDYHFAVQGLAWVRLHEQQILPAHAALDEDVKKGLQLALDRVLLNLIRDTDLWRPDERTSLARTLQRARLLHAELEETASLLSPNQRVQLGSFVEVLALNKLAPSLRGEVVRFRATPASSPEKSEVRPLWMPPEKYDVVWMRPEGKSDQLVGVYAIAEASPPGGWPTIRPVKADVKSSTDAGGISTEDAPLLEITGILLKRLAYSSQRGIDVSPIVIAMDVQPVEELERKALVSIESRTQPATFSKWIEPGVAEENLDVLHQVFESDLVQLQEADDFPSTLERAMDDRESDQLSRVAQILYQMPRMARALADAQLSGGTIGPANLGRLQGWVTRVDSISLTSSRDEEGGPRVIFRLQIEPYDPGAADSSRSIDVVTVFVNHVPKLWLNHRKLRQPVEIEGMSLVGPEEGVRHSVWLAHRPFWSWSWLSSEREPAFQKSTTAQDEPSENAFAFQPAIHSEWLRLGYAGYDFYHIDQVAKLSKQALSATEHAAFYSFIAAADRLPRVDSTHVQPSTTPFDCLKNPSESAMRLLRAKVHVVRVTRISLTREEDQLLLDGNAYYELDGLVEMKGKSIRLVGEDAKTYIDFRDEYPMTLLCKTLPPDLNMSEDLVHDQGQAESQDPAKKATTDTVWYPKKTMEVQGYFYRLWAFETNQTRQAASNSTGRSRYLQNGALVAVTDWLELTETPEPPSDRSIFREVLWGLGLATICLYAIYRLSRSNKPTKRR